MTSLTSKLFHVVHHAVKGKTTTYAIYENNEPYLVPAKGKKLGRREARWIAEILNDTVSS